MVNFDKAIERLKKQREEQEQFSLLEPNERFKIVFKNCYQELKHAGCIINNDNKDKIKKILIYLIKNVFKYNNMNAGFLACIYNFKFGKYIDDNYVKIMIADKQYFKWYIDNIDNRKDDELPNLKEIYKIYYGEE